MEMIILTVGFLLAAYAVVANDSIQTLGTFLASNRQRPWWVLWLFSSSILVAVITFSWFRYSGDVSYQRLNKFPMPENITWVYVLPPIGLLLLTRFGMPVSTTFLVLTVFRPENLGSMLQKSIQGYLLAFVVGFIVYMIISSLLEKRFMRKDAEGTVTPPSRQWIVLQWLSTGFLWSMWLIQDLANVFVYMPRSLSVSHLFMSLTVLVGMQAIIFYQAGGAIQKVVTEKTNTTDVRSATIIDFVYGLILLYFKQLNNIPMSTTWVFLGLLAGRELAFALRLQLQTTRAAGWLMAKDLGKATTGLALSIAIAMLVPVFSPARSTTPAPAPVEVQQVQQGEPAVGTAAMASSDSSTIHWTAQAPTTAH